jgi:Lamin Tail Domain
MTFGSIREMTNSKKLAGLLVLAIGWLAAALPAEVSASGSTAVIYQVQTGSSSSASQEFISIYNNTPEPLDVTNWCVVYSSASDSSQSQLSCLTPPNGQTKVLLSGYKSFLLASNEFTQANPGIQIDSTFNSGMSSTSGHIKLLNAQKEVVDLVGWGSASRPEGSSVPTPSSGNVLQRSNLNQQELRDTNNNSADFSQASLAVPQKGLYEEEVELDFESMDLIITEILPDAVGTDSGKEFIEIYNPNNTPVNLKGYKLQVGPSYSKSYDLPEVTVEPFSFLSLSDNQTKITLPNTSGSVKLLDPLGNTLSTTGIYSELGEGVSWALFDDSWLATYQPTPGLENVILGSKPCPEGQVRSEDTDRCRNITITQSSGSAACRPDQERNPSTNRCRKISSVVVGVLPCKPGQVRGLETNRCRSVSNKSNAKAPCKPDQKRNPETGRCKKLSATNGAKPCPVGQERNKQTNRCRKVAAPVNKNEIKDIESPLVKGDLKWWFAGFSALGSVSYGVYEWRREVFQALSALKIKFLS